MVPKIFYGSLPGRFPVCGRVNGAPKIVSSCFQNSFKTTATTLLLSHPSRRTHFDDPALTWHSQRPGTQEHNDCGMKICVGCPLRPAYIGLATSLLVLNPADVSAIIPKVVRTRSNLRKGKSISLTAED